MAKTAKASPKVLRGAKPARSTTTKAGTAATKKAGPKGRAKPQAAPKPEAKAGPAARPSGGGSSVAVIGGGISGMTAALKLAKAGFDVTLFEMHERLGGNTSSRAVDGIEHDVYPHMFCSWYENFWDLYENELGLDRDANFSARMGSKVLQKGKRKYGELFNPTSVDAIIKNLNSGVMSPAEMFLLGYANLELAAHPFERNASNLMEMLDVNGFIYSRGYGTEDVAEMQNYLLSLIWSIPSAWTAADTYQNFLRHTFTFPNHAPFNFLMKNCLEVGLNAPFQERLDKLGCKTLLKTEVTALRLDDDDRPQVFFRNSIDEHLVHDSLRIEPNANRTASATFDFAVIALPVTKTCEVVLGEPRGRKGRRVIDCVPELSQMQRLMSVSIPVVDLYLKKKVENFPSDHIALAGSKYGMTALDISQLWEKGDFGGKTAIILAASEAAAIPSVQLERQGEMMLQEFAEFYDWFKPGTHWGDPDSDVDWEKTWIRSNLQYRLFLNDTGSWAYRPKTLYAKRLPRVTFAGDCVRTGVDMATVEGAIQGGTQAATAIQAQDARLGGKKIRGEKIKQKPHLLYSTAAFRGARLSLLPFAYLAFVFSAYEQWRRRQKEDHKPLGKNEFTMAEYLALVPAQYAIDWWKAAFWFARSLVQSGNEDPLQTGFPNGAGNRPKPEGDSDLEVDLADNDQFVGLGQAIYDVAREVIDYAASKERQHKKGAAKTPLDWLVHLASKAVDTAFELGEEVSEAATKRQPSGKSFYRRRWRVKN